MDVVMTGFSATEAAFEGFRLTREHPRAVLAWIGAHFAFSLAITLAGIVWVGPDLAAFKAMTPNATDPAQIAVVMKIAPYVLVAVPLEVMFLAVLNCAIYRAVLRPQDNGFGYFRLGADEARMIVVGAVLFLVSLAAVFAVSLVTGIAAATIGMSAGPVGAFVGAVVGAASVVAALWVFVRLSLAAPMTFDQRRVVVFGSWPFTRGAFWPLTGAYIVAFLLGLMICVLLMVISWAIVGAVVAAMHGSLAGIGDVEADITSVRAFLTVPTLISQAVGSVIMIAYYVIVLSPSAIAYQGLAGRRTNAEVFA
jgi:hypothetical protein